MKGERNIRGENNEIAKGVKEKPSIAFVAEYYKRKTKMFIKNILRKYTKNPNGLSVLMTRRGSRNRSNGNLFFNIIIRIVSQVELRKRHSFIGLIVGL